MKDPIVEEVRRNRMKHTKKFKGDLSALCEDLKDLEKSSGHELVRLAPRRLKPGRKAKKKARSR